jgi:ribosomal protein S6--L-glutamate ligase
MIIRTNLELKERYEELKEGDCFIGKLGLKSLRRRILVDLLERGVRFFPSALSQSLASSKVAQALAYRKWMVPHTLVITRRVDLMQAINAYHANGIGAVVTKEDGRNCGFGIHRWEDMEAVYNQASFDTIRYPFVVQPFIDNYTDLRVIVAGDYSEAYTRENAHNFRMNLTAGGRSRPYDLDEENLRFCREVMARGKFPYAHVDVLVTADKRQYLSEISLNGGMKGAQIEREDLDVLKRQILEKMAGL